MGLASRWWTTGPASNAGFGFRRPRCRDPSLGEASLGPRCPVLSRRSPGQSQNESDRDADGAGLAIVSLPQAVVLALQPSTVTFWPSTYPISRSPLRKAAPRYADAACDPALTSPTTGRADCCARATPPSAASNFRRPMVTVIRPSRARCVTERIPRLQRAVFTFEEQDAGYFQLSPRL